MQYEVRALNRNVVTSVLVEAMSEAEARSQVAAQSLQPLSVTLARRGIAAAVSAKPARISLPIFSQELLALLEGGLTIVESIDVLLEKEARPSTRALYAGIARGLAEGKSFSACTADLPEVFPPLYVGMIRSAEKTSGLTAALARYIDYQTRIDAVRSKIVSASIYPAILAIVGACVVGFLAIYVVPRFASVYEGSGRPLPLMSGWLLAWGGFAKSHSLEITVAIAVILLTLAVSFSMARSRGVATRLFLHIPVFSERVRIYGLTRLYLTLGMLLEGGLPITEALALSRGTLGLEQRDALDSASREILNGESLPEAFERAGLTTPVAARFMRVGERSGRLGEMLNRSARYYDGEISRWIDRFTRTFEPLLMVAIGVVVGLIVVLLYMPIFDLAGSLQ
jgi:general secretion pathway protein F